MKKNLLSFSLVMLGITAFAQTPRLSLYEEFTGETCPPCASTNPGLNTLLALPTNTTKIVPIKWQVPIPSAPSNTWSLYQTNKVEIDWRWRTTASGGYGYTPAINSAPSSKIDGQEATVFGAASGHPAGLSSGIIATAQSYTSAFSITMNRAWDQTCSAITLTVAIQATANFTAVGALKFRCVMVERAIHFLVAPGTNGEKDFEDVAIKSFPTLQNGTSMAGTWTIGQTQTFTLNCPIPSYTRNKDEVAFVGFIQDDGNQKVAQAVRADKQALPPDAIAGISSKVPVACTATVAPQVTIQNDGTLNPITSLTLTPYVDGVVGAPTLWTGSIPVGGSANITLNAMPTPTAIGAHSFSCGVVMNSPVYNVTKNTTKINFVVATSYLGAPVAEGFILAQYPPVGWTVVNADNGPTWSRNGVAGGYNLSSQSTKYDFFTNTSVGDKDELFLPPMNLAGSAVPMMVFDVAYAQKDGASNDKLEVMVSNDCGTTWSTIYSNSGAALAASALPVTYAYVPDPNDPSQWRTELLNLTGFNTANVLCKFVATNGNGNNMYIDNVNLSQSAPVGIAKVATAASTVNLFPNPSNGMTNLNITTTQAGTAKVSVINTLGQVVMEKQLNLVAGTNNSIIDMSSFSTGVYSVLVESNNGVTVKKLNLTK